MAQEQDGGVDIFQLLQQASEKNRKEKREQLLQSLGVKELFEEGSIKIDTSICDGVECKLCIEACPTNGLYWGNGKINVVKELCVFCTACVLSCIVDNCITVKRKHPDRTVEEFSSPREASMLLHNINAGKRRDRAECRMEWDRELPSLPEIRPLLPFLKRFGYSRS